MKTSTTKIYDAITEQKIYKELSEPATRFFDQQLHKKHVSQKIVYEFVLARERAAILKDKAYVERVVEQSKNLFFNN